MLRLITTSKAAFRFPTTAVVTQSRVITTRRCLSTHAPKLNLPLEGVKVVDLTRVLAGPYCTQILADLGAEVIKLEHPEKGDDTRAWGPPYAPYKDGSNQEGPGESAYFLSVNRNKKSLGINFKSPEGQKIVKDLIKSADVVVENYVPGTLAKYGLSYEQLNQENLIYASITGYGQTGPYSNRPGYDVMVEAEMGLMHITGEPTGQPVKVGVAVTDLTTGLYAVNSIMASLIQRSKTGRGQYLDICLSDCQVVTLANIASSALISGKPDSGRQGTAHPSICPYQAFETKGGGSIMIGGGNDNLYRLVCDALGKPEWKEDPRFLTNALRVKHRDVLVPAINEITKSKTTKEWLEIFEGRKFPYASVNDIQTTLNHPHVLARDMVVTVDHPACGDIKMVNTPVKYSETQPTIRSAPPLLGQHTDEVVKNLGYSEDEIKVLKKGGVIA
jgi:succinate--hydroxymethylglutarate CoA-transferase